MHVIKIDFNFWVHFQLRRTIVTVGTKLSIEYQRSVDQAHICAVLLESLDLVCIPTYNPRVLTVLNHVLAEGFA